MNKRIKLAEAMGYSRHEYGPDDRLAKLPEGNADGGTYWLFIGDEYLLKDLPDPENDANDCEALIKHLNADYDIGIRFHREHGHSVEIYGVSEQGNKPIHWTGDDWKQGVCELALKVIAG